jgi:IAA-amino acid hydrolase
MLRALLLLVAAAAVSSSPPPTPADLLAAARADAGWIARTRQSLHAIPELGYDLPLTAKRVKAVLKEVGVPSARAKGAEHGVVASVGSGEPVFALRSDMDALPIEVRGVGWARAGEGVGPAPNPVVSCLLFQQEEVDTPSKSRHPGRMHACGHDAHMAMLLGAAKLLRGAAKAGTLPPGTVRLLFQPAEEGGAGGKAMVDAGDLGGVAGVSGIHVWPGLPTGVVSSRAGTLMAAAGRFGATVTGVGGHGAMPHTTVDPVVAAAAVVGALQTLVSREADPTEPAVVTVARFNTGPGASNVIPDSVHLAGTLRAVTVAGFEAHRARVGAVAAAVAAAHRCTATVTWEPVPYVPTVNDAASVDAVRGVVDGMAPAGGVSWLEAPAPTMAAEDFGFMSAAVPAAFAFLGVRNESVGSVHGLHTPRFRVDDGALATGAALHAATAIAGLVRAAGLRGVGGRGEGRSEL